MNTNAANAMDEVDVIFDALGEFFPTEREEVDVERAPHRTDRNKTCDCDAALVPVSRGTLAACASCGAIAEELRPVHAAKPDADVVSRCGPQSSALYPMSRPAECSGTSAVRSGIHHKDRSVYVASAMMRERAREAAVSEATVTVAENLFRRVVDAPSMTGARRDGIVEGAMYAAARACGVPRTPAEIAKMFGVSTRIVCRGAQKVAGVLSQSQTAESSASPMAFISRYVANAPRRAPETGVLSSLVRAYILETTAMSQMSGRNDGVIVEDIAPHVVAAVAFALAWEHTGRTGGVDSASAASGIARSTVGRYVASVAPTERRARLVTRVSLRVLRTRGPQFGTIHEWAGMCSKTTYGVCCRSSTGAHTLFS